MEKQIFTKDVQALLDKHYETLTDEEKEQFDANIDQMTDEQKEAFDKGMQQQFALAEIFSQCWDDEDFKAEFKADPKKIMDKFGVEYDDNVDYVVLDNAPKTITYVLPFEGVKETVSALADSFKDKVADVVEGKQVIPENWSFKFIQNTEDINYIVIPMSPENLTPEELEFVNGCGFFSWLKDNFMENVFISQHLVLVTDIGAAVSVLVILGIVFFAVAVSVVE